MIVLDSDHMTALERANSREGIRLKQRLAQVKLHDRSTTIISYEEQSRGWLKFVKKARNSEDQVAAYRRLQKHLKTYSSINVLDFDERAATEAERLQKLRLRIGTLDERIAAIALAHGATLLSCNLRDFSKVPDLKVEDWTVEPE